MINKTVLVVERDPSEAKKIVGFFNRHGFRNPLEIVGSKAEALDFVFKTGRYEGREDLEMPGLILLDLLTNKTSDTKILKPLQAYLRTQKIPIVVLISSVEQEEEVGKLGFGIVGFIRKPLDLTHFVEVIQYMGMKWREEPA
jgi:two-component system, response regulator